MFPQLKLRGDSSLGDLEGECDRDMRSPGGIDARGIVGVVLSARSEQQQQSPLWSQNCILGQVPGPSLNSPLRQTFQSLLLLFPFPLSPPSSPSTSITPRFSLCHRHVSQENGLHPPLSPRCRPRWHRHRPLHRIILPIHRSSGISYRVRRSLLERYIPLECYRTRQGR